MGPPPPPRHLRVKMSSQIYLFIYFYLLIPSDDFAMILFVQRFTQVDRTNTFKKGLLPLCICFLYNY